jgi:hypothetical protein
MAKQLTFWRTSAAFLGVNGNSGFGGSGAFGTAGSSFGFFFLNISLLGSFQWSVFLMRQ